MATSQALFCSDRAKKFSAEPNRCKAKLIKPGFAVRGGLLAAADALDGPAHRDIRRHDEESRAKAERIIAAARREERARPKVNNGKF